MSLVGSLTLQAEGGIRCIPESEQTSLTLKILTQEIKAEKI
jgi:hypothetical protein